MSDAPSGQQETTWAVAEAVRCLLRAARLAFDVRKVALAAVAMTAVSGAWWLSAQLFSGSRDVRLIAQSDPAFDGHPLQSLGTPLPVIAAEPTSPAADWFLRSPVLDVWALLSLPFRQLFDVRQSYVEFAFWLLCAVLTVLVWALAGGVITRMSALELAREERPSPRRAFGYSRSKWADYFFAPVYPIVGAILVAVPMILLGWLLRFDVGLLLAAVAWPMLIVLGAVIAVFLLAILVGWPLLFATISVEGTDAFDAMSRTYAYVYQRPLHYAVYVVGASILGFFAWIVVTAFFAMVVYLTFWGVSWSAGATAANRVFAELPPAVRMGAVGMPEVGEGTILAERSGNAADADIAVQTTGTAAGQGTIRRLAVGLVAMWVGLIKLLALAFAYSYFWTAATAIYLLMRRDVDATEIDEVFVEEDDELHGLPAIENDDQGAPVAVEPNDNTSEVLNGEPQPTGDSPEPSPTQPSAGNQ